MPHYKINITDPRAVQVREAMEKNITNVRKQLLQADKRGINKTMNSLYTMVGKAQGINLSWNIEFKTDWIEDNVLNLSIETTAPIDKKYFDSQVKAFGVWGKMIIERTDKTFKKTEEVILNG